MEKSSLRFYSGSGSAPPLTLARFLPPLPTGITSAWLKDNVPTGSWILDPLGASPTLVLEAARAGYRVLMACNNPILQFLIEMMASAPRTADFQAALADLATSRRGNERLENHLANLYLTECENCGEHIQAQAYLWRKGENQPYGRIYHCPKCNEAPGGERPITQFDLDRLKAMGGDRLQRERALQRVIINEDDRRTDVEEALESYLSRPLYVIFTLLNKIDGMNQTSQRAYLLQILMLAVFDAGNTLWAWPGGRTRPRQLSPPTQFRENNLWMILEEAAASTAVEWNDLAVENPGPVIVTKWPDLPPDEMEENGAICLFRGRVKALMPLPENVTPHAVVTVFPRPSQAFWTLSVLWAGWLWGPEAALPIRNVLDRRRYDWNWHTSAVFSALSGVGTNLEQGTPLFGLLPEVAPGFLSAVMCANQAAGFQVDDLAMRSEEEIVQVKGRILRPEQSTGSVSAETRGKADQTTLEQAARANIRKDLLLRSEPASYLTEYTAGLHALIKTGAVSYTTANIPGDLLTRVQAILAHVFSDRNFLKVYGGPPEESGWWWLSGERTKTPELLSAPTSPGGVDVGQLPLADQVEVEVIRFMQKHLAFSFDELDEALCQRFPGLLTPSTELIKACLESYGEVVQSRPGMWHLGASESSTARKQDLLEMQIALEKIGNKLGYKTIENGSTLSWETDERSQADQKGWHFYRMASSIISRFVLAPDVLVEGRSVLVLPGSRARLLSLKLRRDPRLAEAAQGWRFLKYRHLRDIAARQDMNTALWESLLDEDPLTEEARQMQLFS